MKAETKEKVGATPGPWEVDEFRPGDWRVKAPDGSDGCWWIAEVSGIPGTEHANARLIAAAPELRDALRGLAVDYHRLAFECVKRRGTELQDDELSDRLATESPMGQVRALLARLETP